MATCALTVDKDLKEKQENKEDIKLAIKAYKTLDRDNLEEFSRVCEDCGIDYKEL